MKRRSRFIVALLAAGLTFGALTATVGTDHWKHRGHHGWYHYHHHDCDLDEQKSKPESDPGI